MGRTDKKVGYSPTGMLSGVTPGLAAQGVDDVFRMLGGKWKMRIVFQLFAQTVQRYSELERAIPEVSQRVLGRQLRELERDGLVERKVFPEVPPKVEYRLSAWGSALCPVLDTLLEWRARNRPSAAG